MTADFKDQAENCRDCVGPFPTQLIGSASVLEIVATVAGEQ